MFVFCLLRAAMLMAVSSAPAPPLPGPCGQLCLLSAPPCPLPPRRDVWGLPESQLPPPGTQDGGTQTPLPGCRRGLTLHPQFPAERVVREKGRQGETVGIPLRLFHPRTLQETWENALGWFLPNLAPPECGLHSILESLPVCLLISCMTDPLLQRCMAGSPVWGGTHLLGLWTRSKQVTVAQKSCGWGGARVRMGVLGVGRRGFAEQSLRGAWGPLSAPTSPGLHAGPVFRLRPSRSGSRLQLVLHLALGVGPACWRRGPA